MIEAPALLVVANTVGRGGRVERRDTLLTCWGINHATTKKKITVGAHRRDVQAAFDPVRNTAKDYSDYSEQQRLRAAARLAEARLLDRSECRRAPEPS